MIWITCKVLLAPNAQAGELIHLGQYLTNIQAERRSDGPEGGAVQVQALSAGDLEGLRKGVMPPGQEGTAFFFLAVGADDPADAGQLLCRCLRAFIPHPVIAIQPELHLPANSFPGAAPAVGQPGEA